MTSVLWLRRDLRLRDHPALHEAAKDGPVVALFVLDPALLKPAGAPRVAFLYRTLRALDADLREHGGRLVVRRGDPVRVVPRVAREVGASSVHVSADFGPYGARARRRGRATRSATCALVRTGSPYAVAPGRVRQGRRHAVQGLHAVLPRLARARLARTRRATITGRVDWHTDARRHRHPERPARCRPASSCPRPARTPRCAAWRAYRKTALARLRRRPRPSRPRPHLAHVGVPEVGLHPPAHDARRPRRRATRRSARSSRGASSTPRCCTTGRSSAREYFQPQLATMTYARPDIDGVRRLARGTHRLPDRRRRHAAAARRRAGCTTGCA